MPRTRQSPSADPPERDAALLRALRSADESQSGAALARIIERYTDTLIQQASRRMDSAAAADLVQDLFVYLWDRRADLTVTGSLVAYLRSAITRGAAQYRRNQKTASRNLRLLGRLLPISTDNDATRFLILDDLERITKAVHDQTDGLTYQIFACSYYERLSEEEIAETLSVSLTTVYKHLRIVRTGIERALIAEGVFTADEIKRFFASYHFFETSRTPWEHPHD